jgi:hypothetical protein
VSKDPQILYYHNVAGKYSGYNQKNLSAPELGVQVKKISKFIVWMFFLVDKSF